MCVRVCSSVMCEDFNHQLWITQTKYLHSRIRTRTQVLISLLREKFVVDSNDDDEENDLNRGLAEETLHFDANVKALGRVSRKLRMSSRVREACDVVPNMITLYFEILLKDAPSHCVLSTLRKVFQRLEFVFGPKSYRVEVRTVFRIRHSKTYIQKKSHTGTQTTLERFPRFY